MFTCDVTKARSLARNFVCRELSFIFTRDVSYRFNGKNDNVVLESKIIHSKAKLFRFYHDKEKKTYIDTAVYYGHIFGGRKCSHATSQKRALS